MSFTKTFLVASSAFLLSACGGSPDSAVKDLHVAIAAGDIDRALKNVDVEEVAEAGFSEQKVRRTLAIRKERYSANNCKGIKSVDVGSGEIDGSKAVFPKVIITCTTGLEMTLKHRLRKVDGEWRVSVL